MGLDGLTVVLEKQPIIPTYKSRDFWSSPSAVEAAYERHVRSYVSLAPDHEDGAASVEAFQRKLNRMVKEARAPLGYVTAEYGYGKTTTGLFLWQAARRENILAVPPFSFDAMEDLVVAVGGWARFAVDRVHPGLGCKVEESYNRYHREGIEGLARIEAGETGRLYEQVLSDLRRLDQQGRLRLRLMDLDYVSFLSEMTDIAKEAGFEGILIVADELQQYIEHEDVTAAREPIADLFDLIKVILTRRGRLACGLIFLLPNKELGFINEQRGDLVQRIKDDRLALDLAQVYGPEFAQRLWTRLAEEFDFADIAHKVISPEALLAAGEIAARSDLASGPRTVVDVLKIASRRFLDGTPSPYGLLDLVSSFETNEIAFDGVSRIQSAVRQALLHDLVRGNPEAERAVRLMAAFPTTGLTEELQEREGIRDAADDLARLAVGELVAIRGGGFDHLGKVIKAGATLMALQPASHQVSWLKGTIRNFRRDYFLGSKRVHDLAVNGFRSLLVERLFTAPNWKIEHERQATPITQNSGLLFRGTFPQVSRQFPDRLVYCRLVGPGETVHDTPPDHDILVDFVLGVPVEQTAGALRHEPGRLVWMAPSHARVELNLLHRDPDANYVDLSPGFGDIVAPYDVNPLLTLSLHESLRQSLTSGRVPGPEESHVRDLFLPALLTAALRDVFNAQLGSSAEPRIPTAEVRFVETLFQTLCQRAYGDQYVTMMVTGSWQSAIRQYRGAIDRIDHPLVRSGQEGFQGTKKQVADLLGRTNPSLDNFIQTFPQLISVEEGFKGDSPGIVKFTLHPLERRIQQLVEQGLKQIRLHPRTKQLTDVPTVGLPDLWTALKPLGYKQEEMDAALDLLETRQLVQRDPARGLVVGLEPDIPPIDEVRSALEVVQQRLITLKPVLDAAFFGSTERALAPYIAAAKRDVPSLTPNQLINARRVADRLASELDAAVAQRCQQLANEAARVVAAGTDDPRQETALSQATTGGLFVDELNTVRVALMREAGVLRTQLLSTVADARGAKELLDQPGISDQALVGCFEKLGRTREGLADIHRQREMLQGRVAAYREAERLLQEATTLLNEKILVFGSSIETERHELDRWARDIKEALLTQRVQALQQLESWRGRFQTVKGKVTTFEQSRKEAFAERQQALKKVLRDCFRVKQEDLGMLLTYNPVNPEESYRLLESQFKDAVKSASQVLRRRTEEIARSAREMLAMDTLSHLSSEERSLAIKDMHHVENEVPRVEADLNKGFSALLCLTVTSSDVTSELLEQKASGVIALAEPIKDLALKVQSLRRLLQETALTEEEKRANEILLDLGTSGDVDFTEFQLRLRQGLGTPDPWAVVRALAQKSRVRVRIQVLRQ